MGVNNGVADALSRGFKDHPDLTLVDVPADARDIVLQALACR